MTARVAALLAVLAAVACLPPSHFVDISDTLARRDLQCSAVLVTAYEDASWGLRAEGCGKVAFYRCSYARKTMGRTQCCHRVPTEDAATAFLAASVPEPYCEDHGP